MCGSRENIKSVNLEPDAKTCLTLAKIDSFFESSGSHRRVLIYDCCNIGIPTFLNTKGLCHDLAFGTRKLYSSSFYQNSYEIKGNGFFTYFLLQSLNNKNLLINGYLTLDKVRYYIEDNMGQYLEQKNYNPDLFQIPTFEGLGLGDLQLSPILDENLLTFQPPLCPLIALDKNNKKDSSSKIPSVTSTTTTTSTTSNIDKEKKLVELQEKLKNVQESYKSREKSLKKKLQRK